jgi:putative ABC transport system ATP-binding protein
MSNILKTYATKYLTVNALSNVSFEIGAGEMIAVMGPSGSGKTTLLNIIGLIDSATSGEYFIDGESVAEYSPQKLSKLRNAMFGFVLQDFALIERYSVTQNIRVPLVYSDTPKSDWKRKIAAALNHVGISEKAKSLPSELSGGQRQRVAIARALINEANFILADEPTGALDTATGDGIMDIFSKIKEAGKSIIIVTHDLHIAEKCDRIMNLHDGKLIGRQGDV